MTKNNEQSGIAELKYESRCRDVAVLRLYKDFGIIQNRFHTWNQQRQQSSRTSFLDTRQKV
ncbi:MULTISPECIES: hypothetical protein [unclassified Nostoc]|uniref:hypothetical protein n=1 Tax=unclassified Nostoc TaxID=2593658 RepID=UPI002AD52886|nr:hypothetical protein [Nostoc sp. DedQUE03]MDZ7976656.1 hypothetical protein [Nostoc sp. DedQUE03]MDZ8048751.1 hypothetical protein [Nostoc sp. DedQUE02]